MWTVWGEIRVRYKKKEGEKEEIRAREKGEVTDPTDQDLIMYSYSSGLSTLITIFQWD